jgi:diaminohydroxyphosphoribosylaminopyrimidine deaminase/5-amino-6-(5-phosphoribosylamino)uracil reductase
VHPDQDARWLAAAAALAERSRPLAWPNPGVAAIIVRDDIVVGRGWTAPGGRPHAEALALAQAGAAAQGATMYVTLEPCAHHSVRGPACADLVAQSGVARVVAGMLDPDPRTSGEGLARLARSGVDVACPDDPACAASLDGYVRAKVGGFPEVTLKLALTADGFVARPDGTSKWITGEAARAHGHRERARADAILVGSGTFRADASRLDVRLPGLASRSPRRLLLTRGAAPPGWTAIARPQEIGPLGLQHLMIEGGAQTAAAFLEAGLVHRLLLYRSSTRFGQGIPAFANPGAAGVPPGWQLVDRRPLGSDRLEVYIPAGSEGT